MSILSYVNISETVIHSRTTAELASAAKKQGKKVIQSLGSYWQESIPGYFEPMHWLSRMTIDQVKRTTPYCWGYRSTLQLDNICYANGYMPIHLLDDVDNYREASLPSKRRNQLRKSRKIVSVVQICDPQLLFDQGYHVLKSAVQRTGHGSVPSFTQYCFNIQQQIINSKSITLAGLVNGNLAGYMVLSAVDDIMYIDTVVLASDYLSTDIGTSLIFEAVQVARRSEQIKIVVYGLHSIEDPKLGVFKDGMGFNVRFWPLRYQIPSVLLKYMGWRAPEKLYRLTGLNNLQPRGFLNDTKNV